VRNLERLDVWVKSIVIVSGGFVSYLIGGVGLAITVLLGLMLIDLITGLMVAAYNKNVSSKIGSKGFIRKLYVILLIGAVYLVEKVAFEQAGYIGDGVVVAYCIIEFISIVENGGKMGLPIPEPLKKIIEVLKPKSEQ
jgi:toxin secretion/phage lysis holin